MGHNSVKISFLFFSSYTQGHYSVKINSIIFLNTIFRLNLYLLDVSMMSFDIDLRLQIG